MELIKFIFSGVWTFFGFLLLMFVLLAGIEDIVKAIRKKL